MLKRIDRLMNGFIGSFIGVFIGHGIFVFWDYKKYPEIYAMQSAPWYSSILVYGVFTIVIVAVALIVKSIIRKKTKV